MGPNLVQATNQILTTYNKLFLRFPPPVLLLQFQLRTWTANHIFLVYYTDDPSQFLHSTINKYYCEETNIKSKNLSLKVSSPLKISHVHYKVQRNTEGNQTRLSRSENQKEIRKQPGKPEETIVRDLITCKNKREKNLIRKKSSYTRSPFLKFLLKSLEHLGLLNCSSQKTSQWA